MSEVLEDTRALDAVKGLPDVAVIGSFAQQAVMPQQLHDGDIYAVLDEHGKTTILKTPHVEVMELSEDDGRPQHLHTVSVCQDLDSFLAAVEARQSGELGVLGQLEVWEAGGTVIAFLDGVYGFARNVVRLEPVPDADWREWVGIDGSLASQTQFAEFIEDHLSTIAEPDGAELLEVCQTLMANTKVAFKSSQLLSNGQRQFAYEEQVEAKAGQKGTLKVPTALTLALSPFEGMDVQPVTARFRYRLRDGELSMGVKLLGTREIEKTVRTGLRQAIGDKLGVHVNVGMFSQMSY